MIEDEVLSICKTPDIGELKKGDLSNIRVYKFKFHNQEYLIAYSYSESDDEIQFLSVDFYQIGTHENFYTNLKKYLKSG